MLHDPDHRRGLVLFADLLDYPDLGLTDKVVECEALFGSTVPDATALLNDFRSFTEENQIDKLEEIYSGFFDLNAVCHPYLGFQLFGENYKRSSLMLGLLDSYRAEGFQALPNDLPDRLSNVLRFIAHSKADEEADVLTREMLLPAIERMTSRHESGFSDYDAHPAEFDGDTGVEISPPDSIASNPYAAIEGADRYQLAGDDNGEKLDGGFVLKMGSSDSENESVVKRVHPYYQVLEALRVVLHKTYVTDLRREAS